MSDRQANPTQTPPPPPGLSGGGGPAWAGTSPDDVTERTLEWTVVLADDHEITRQGLRTLLAAEADMRIVAECSDGREALEQVRRHQPDLLVSDLSMPGLNGLEVAREVRSASPGTRVIIVSVHTEEPYLIEAFRRGVRGYVLKSTSGACLARAVRTVLAGERYLSPAFPHSLLR